MGGGGGVALLTVSIQLVYILGGIYVWWEGVIVGMASNFNKYSNEVIRVVEYAQDLAQLKDTPVLNVC